MKIDKKRYALLLAGSEKVKLTKRQEDSAKAFVREEIREGRTEKREWNKRLAEVKDGLLRMTQEVAALRAEQEATIELPVPGESEVIDELLKSQNAERIADICADAPNWPIAMGSVLPMYLCEHAAAFIAAKNNPRFPRSDRPTTTLKKLWFLSRALAGAVFEIEPRTAINLVGSKRPEEVFEESRAARPKRKKKLSRQGPKE